MASLLLLFGLPSFATTQDVQAGGLRYTFDMQQANPAEQARWYKYVSLYRCQLSGLNPLQAQFFSMATDHIQAVLADPHFQTVMAKKKTWVGTPHTAAQILYRLKNQSSRVIVQAFGADRTHPCNSPKATGHTNAFASPPGAPEQLLFLFNRYLETQMLAPDLSKATRTLARTVIHESLHTLGYSHFDPRTAQSYPFGSLTYNNTVPVYVGCLVMNWAPQPKEQERIRLNCEFDNKHQVPSVYEWKCPSIEAFRSGETVLFKQYQGWAKGLIVARYKNATVSLQSGGKIYHEVSVCRLKKWSG